MKNKIKVQIHVKRKVRRNDSMFYYGKHIATVSKGKREVIVESAGEMRMFFNEGGSSYQNQDLAKELVKRKIHDTKLNNLGKSDQISMNNWFRVVEFAHSAPFQASLNEEIAHTYDDAIALAKNILDKK